MKKYFIPFIILSAVILFGAIFYACSDDTSDSRTDRVFPTYSAELFGTSLNHRTPPSCSCSSTSCNTEKYCPPGKSCSCTCSQSHVGSTCTCSECTFGGYQEVDYWLTTEQVTMWGDLYEILEGDASAAGGTARDYLLDFMDGIANDDEAAVETAHSGLFATLPSLQSATKTEINGFYDYYELEDDRL